MPVKRQNTATRSRWLPSAQGLKQGCQFGLKLLAVPIGLAGSILLGWGLTGAVQKLSLHSKMTQVWLCVVGLLIVIDALLSFWDRLPREDQQRAFERWQGLTDRLLRSRSLSPWPVLLVLLTSLLGLTDWFPANGSERLMMLSSIATVAIYGYFREKAEKREDLLAFADTARDRFAEAAKQIHAERDREIERRNRQIEEGERIAEIDRLIDDLQDCFAELKADAQAFNIPFRDLVDTDELRAQLRSEGFSPNDAEFQYILTRLGVTE